MRHIFLALIRTLELFAEFPSRIKNWILVRVCQKHKKYTITGKVREFDSIAIFVIYPGTSPLASVQRIIASLHKARFSVVLVINENQNHPKLDLSQWEKDCLILSRANIGFDFGGFKSAIEYLKKIREYENIKSLVLINDSMYVSPRSQIALDEILNPNTPSNCIFLHRQGAVHAASMCLVFKEATIQSQGFVNFWNSYYPTSSKKKAVRNGEHKLSKVAGLLTFKPYVDIDSIQNVKNKKFLLSEAAQLIEWSERNSFSGARFVKIMFSGEDFSEAYSYSVFNFQISNALGLYVNRTLNVPLKMDLVKQGLVTPTEFLERASDSRVSKDELNELRQILEKKGSYLTVSPLRRYMRQ